MRSRVDRSGSVFGEQRATRDHVKAGVDAQPERMGHSACLFALRWLFAKDAPSSTTWPSAPDDFRVMERRYVAGVPRHRFGAFARGDRGAQQLPILVLSPIAGVWADRVNRRAC